MTRTVPMADDAPLALAAGVGVTPEMRMEARDMARCLDLCAGVAAHLAAGSPDATSRSIRRWSLHCLAVALREGLQSRDDLVGHALALETFVATGVNLFVPPAPSPTADEGADA